MPFVVAVTESVVVMEVEMGRVPCHLGTCQAPSFTLEFAAGTLNVEHALHAMMTNNGDDGGGSLSKCLLSSSPFLYSKSTHAL